MNEMVDYLNTTATKEGYKVLTLFVTDIFDNISYCLYNDQADDILMQGFKLEKIYQGIPLKGVVSRKIQIVPNIMEVLDR
jgi:inorganic pyrophosphatase/exopolyphosphatase